MSSLSVRKKMLLKRANDHLWHRWPLLLLPLVSGFKAKQGYFPNFLRPRSLNEKILYRMLFDRRAFLPVFAGKLEGRAFVSERLGSDDALMPLKGVLYSVGDVETMEFPRQFVLKANHGSGMNYFHTADAPPDLDKVKEICRQWLNYDFAKYSREWCYKDVRRAVLVEEFVPDAQGGIPVDYKFYCYDGVPRYVKVDTGRFTRHATDLFDSEWNRVPGCFPYANCEVLPERPSHLSEMLAMAAALSKGIDFVRVDLYDTGAAVKFGELTNTPGRGTERFTPQSLDRVFGEPWKVKLTRGRGGV